MDTLGIPIVVLVIGILCLALISGGGRKGELIADARWAGRKEKLNAWKKAIAQSKNPEIDSTSLFLGRLPKCPWMTALEILLFNKSSSVVPFANTQGSILVFGSPDVGKTTTINNRIIQDNLRRKLGPMIVFDPKGDLVVANAPYAEALGWESFFLAPGRKYTDALNMFDFFKGRDRILSTVTNQAAISTIRNTKSADAGKSDAFFGASGEALVRSGMMLTHHSPYKDLVMLKEVLCAENLASRVRELEIQGELPWQVASSFRQFISGKSSDKTLGGIQATASLVFDSFVREEFFNAFVRQSTIPLNLSGKQVIFIQPMRGFEDVCMPVISTLIELLIERNFATPRNDSLLLLVDEKHLTYFPSLMKWSAFLRSSGLIMVLLTQAISQIRQRYGQNDVNTMFSTFRTKIFMNPDDLETAKWVSEKVGDVDKFYRQSSRSYGKGGNRTDSKQRRQTRLISPQKVNSMKRGEFIYWNSANANDEEDGLPVKLRYVVPQEELDLETNCKKFWKEVMLPRVIKERQPKHLTSEQMAEFFAKRAKAIDFLFPLPKEEEQKTASDPIFKKQPHLKGVIKNNVEQILPRRTRHGSSPVESTLTS